jgi:hypothetical protein
MLCLFAQPKVITLSDFFCIQIYKPNGVQAALVICGLGICGFDYLRVRKQGITENIEENFINLSLK